MQIIERIKNVFRGSDRRLARKPSRFRPTLEALEDRAVPADFYWTGNTSYTWAVSSNWTISSGTDDDGLPDSNDDVTIDGGTSDRQPVIAASTTEHVNYLYVDTGEVLNLGGTLAVTTNSTIYGTLLLSYSGSGSHIGNLYISAGGVLNCGPGAYVDGNLSIGYSTVNFYDAYSDLTVTNLSIDHSTINMQLISGDNNYIACTDITLGTDAAIVVSVPSIEDTWTLIAHSGTKTGSWQSVTFTGYTDGLDYGWNGSGSGSFWVERDV